MAHRNFIFFRCNYDMVYGSHSDHHNSRKKYFLTPQDRDTFSSPPPSTCTNAYVCRVAHGGRAGGRDFAQPPAIRKRAHQRTSMCCVCYGMTASAD